jgi:unsaturated chondroitin disaccharide hydrolase
MINIDKQINAADLLPKIERFWELSAQKVDAIQKHYDFSKGSPVYTVNGIYTSRGWTEWTQGFHFGSAILQYDATGQKEFLNLGRSGALDLMSPHLTHMGVHDHGFNNVSTYGNLLRLTREGKLGDNEWERHFYELALKCSGAVQGRRWTSITKEEGFIYSFNGPHSLFADTIRSLRSLAMAYKLGHPLLEEDDRAISLLERLIQHARITSKYNVYYNEGRDSYDVRGRVAHESIFNLNDGSYRCPSTQQGYSPLTTWTRGLAWIMCGYAEELEFLETIEDSELEQFGGRQEIEAFMLRAAQATCDFYIANTPTNGIPYWDTGAPNLYKIGDYLNKPADPFNSYEPVDSSAAAIAAQGLLRLGHYLTSKGKDGEIFWQAGLTVLDNLLAEPYLSTDLQHQGLILHSTYHVPKGWDNIPPGSTIPFGESSMWGDYHAREAALYVKRVAIGEPYLTFYVNRED